MPPGLIRHDDEEMLESAGSGGGQDKATCAFDVIPVRAGAAVNYVELSGLFGESGLMAIAASYDSVEDAQRADELMTSINLQSCLELDGFGDLVATTGGAKSAEQTKLFAPAGSLFHFYVSVNQLERDVVMIITQSAELAIETAGETLERLNG